MEEGKGAARGSRAGKWRIAVAPPWARPARNLSAISFSAFSTEARSYAALLAKASGLGCIKFPSIGESGHWVMSLWIARKSPLLADTSHRIDDLILETTFAFYSLTLTYSGALSKP